MFESTKTKMERGWANRGGVITLNFLGGGLGLHLAMFLTCFALVLSNTNYIFAEISRNGLGSIPLKVIATDNFCHFIFSYFFASLSRAVP